MTDSDADRVRIPNAGSVSSLGKAAAAADSAGGFTCPECQRTSYHPEDLRQGYCSACRAFTGPDQSRLS